MLNVLGILLVVYALFVLLQLYIWRKNVLKFVERLLKSAYQLVSEGEALLEPISQAGAATRAGASEVSNAADTISLTIPPILQNLAADLTTTKDIIAGYRPIIIEVIEKVSGILDETISDVANLLEQRVNPDLIALAGDSQDIRTLIDDFEWYQLTERAFELLRNDGVPGEVLDKLQLIRDTKFETLEAFTQRLQQGDLLTPEEFDAFKDKIFTHARNPNSKGDVVGLIEQLVKTIYEEGDQGSIAKTLEKAGETLELISPGLSFLIGTLVGSQAPLALIVFSLTNSILVVKEVIDKINQLASFEIPIGALSSTLPLTLPNSIRIPLQFTIAPPSIISFRYPSGISFPDIVEFSDYKWPREPRVFEQTVIGLGDWENIILPPIPQEPKPLFRIPPVLSTVEDVRNLAQSVLNPPETTLLIAEKLNEMARSIKETSEKLKEVSNRLVGINQKLSDIAPSFGTIAKKLDILAEDMMARARKYRDIRSRIIDTLKNFKEGTDTALGQAITTFDSVIVDVNAINVQPLIRDIKNVAGRVTEIANQIDDGKPIDSPGKKDLLQKLHTLLRTLKGGIPSLDNFKSIFQPLYLIVMALHIGVLFIGLWLIWSNA